MPVLRALLYLRLMSLRNALRVRLQRLRQPKYLLGALAGAAYFWFFFLRRRGPGSSGQALAVVFGGGHAELAAAGMLTLFLLLIWVLPGDQPGLAFSEAEVAFLFPAPLTRRQLIHYKLLNGLVLSLFGSLFFTLLSTGLSQGWLRAMRHLAAWWLLNSNLTLHGTAASLIITRLSNFGLHTRLRRWLLLGGVAALLAAAFTVVWYRGPASLTWILWPARLVVRPFLAGPLADYLLALTPAAGLLAAHYLRVLQMETPFEEASVVRAQKAGEVLARVRAGKGVRLGGTGPKVRRSPFSLGNRLPPECAFLWKNLMLAPPYLNRKTFAGTAAVLVFGLTWLKTQAAFDGPKDASVAGFVALVFLGYMLVFGPQLARIDLRSDLLNADLLKTYPLPGWRIVLGQLLAPAVLLTGVGWLLLLCAAVGVTPPSETSEWLTPGVRIAAALSLAVVLPALCALQLLVPNAATLIFPGWGQNLRTAGGGFDIMGQRLIFFAGQLLCLLCVLLPPAVAGWLTGFICYRLFTGLAAAIGIATVPVLLALAGELWLGVWLVGPLFEKLDISAEMRP